MSTGPSYSAAVITAMTQQYQRQLLVNDKSILRNKMLKSAILNNLPKVLLC